MKTSIFDWLFNWNRQLKVENRKQKLGERFTSDLTWRKFNTEDLKRLNPNIDFDNIESIYEIGLSNAKKDIFQKLLKFIEEERFDKIASLNNTIDEGYDNIGYVPMGDYIQTNIWKVKNEKSFLQLAKGSFDNFEQKKIKFEKNINFIDVKTLANRKLIYPI